MSAGPLPYTPAGLTKRRREDDRCRLPSQMDAEELAFIEEMKVLARKGEPRDPPIDAFLAERYPGYSYSPLEGASTLREYAKENGLEVDVLRDACRLARDRYHEIMRASEVPQEELETNVPVGTKRLSCIRCGDPLKPKQQKYCGRECAQAADRSRREEARKKAMAEHPPCTRCGRPVKPRKGESLGEYRKRQSCGLVCPDEEK